MDTVNGRFFIFCHNCDHELNTLIINLRKDLDFVLSEELTDVQIKSY